MLREILARFGFKVDAQQLEAANQKVNFFKTTLGKVAGLLSVGLVARSLKGFVTDMINVGDEAAKTARQMGLTTNQFEALAFAAERSGVDKPAFTQGLQRLQKNALEAAEGNKMLSDTFRRMGVELYDAQGGLLPANDLVRNLATALQNTENPTERVAIAMRLMGRSGARLIPLLKDGAGGLDALTQRFDEIGGGFSDEFTENAEEALDAITDFDVAMRGIKSVLVTQLLPVVTATLDKLTMWTASLRKATEGTHVWELAIGALVAALVIGGAASFASWLPTIAIFLLIAAGVAAIILLVDDLITFFEGGRSLIGEALDDMFGEGTQQKVRDWFSEVGDGFALMWADLSELPGWLADQITAAGEAIFSWGQDAKQTIAAFLGWAQKGFTRFGKWIGGLFSGIQQKLINAANIIPGAAAFLGIGGSDTRTASGEPRVTTRGVRPAQVTQTQTNNIHVNGGNPENVRRVVEQAIGDANRRERRTASRALGQVAP